MCRVCMQACTAYLAGQLCGLQTGALLCTCSPVLGAGDSLHSDVQSQRDAGHSGRGCKVLAHAVLGAKDCLGAGLFSHTGTHLQARGNRLGHAVPRAGLALVQACSPVKTLGPRSGCTSVAHAVLVMPQIQAGSAALALTLRQVRHALARWCWVQRLALVQAC